MGGRVRQIRPAASLRFRRWVDLTMRTLTSTRCSATRRLRRATISGLPKPVKGIIKAKIQVKDQRQKCHIQVILYKNICYFVLSVDSLARCDNLFLYLAINIAPSSSKAFFQKK